MSKFNKVNKLGNEYFDAAGRDVFSKCPKAVWAAIAISALTCGGDHLDEARELVLKEWAILHQNGIVPQAPPKGVA